MSAQPTTPFSSDPKLDSINGASPTHPAIGFIKTLFQPNDRLCIGFINHNAGNGPWSQTFVTAADLATTNGVDRLLMKNKHSSIYCSMNAFKEGRDERSKANVAATRNVYIDIDSDGPEKRDKVLRSSALPCPTYILESSPNKFQIIWSLEQEMPIHEHERLLKAIATEFGGDPQSTDAARVLRLPGFINRKSNYVGEPVVSIWSESPNKYTPSAFTVALPPPIVKKQRSSAATVYDLIFDELDWQPLAERMAEEILEGAPHNCPFHIHHEPGNFGIMVANPRLVHCFGEGHGDINANVKGQHTFDLVAAVRAFDGRAETMRECAKRLCNEYGVDFARLEAEADKASAEEAARIESKRIDDLIANAKADVPNNAGDESAQHAPEVPKQAADTEEPKHTASAEQSAESIPEEPKDSGSGHEGEAKTPAIPLLFQIAQQAADLCDTPVEWIVDGVYPRGGLSLVCGREGVGKGNHAFASVAAILKGTDFLGQATSPVPYIVYVDLENPESVVYDRLRRLGVLDNPRLYIWGQWNKTMPPPPDLTHQLYAQCAEETGAFFFFDSLVGFSKGSDENDAAAMYAIMDAGRSLARKCAGVHFQHHAGKDSASGFRGSTAITGGADMAWGLSAKGDVLIFKTLKARMTEGRQIEFSCSFDDDGLNLRRTVYRSKEGSNEQDSNGLKQTLDIIRATPGMTRAELRKALRKAGFTTRQTADLIVKSAPHCRTESAGPGKPIRVYIKDPAPRSTEPVN